MKSNVDLLRDMLMRAGKIGEGESPEMQALYGDHMETWHAGISMEFACLYGEIQKDDYGNHG